MTALDSRNILVHWETPDYTVMPRWWLSIMMAVLPREIGEMDRKDWKDTLGTRSFHPHRLCQRGDDHLQKESKLLGL